MNISVKTELNDAFENSHSEVPFLYTICKSDISYYVKHTGDLDEIFI